MNVHGFNDINNPNSGQGRTNRPNQNNIHGLNDPPASANALNNRQRQNGRSRRQTSNQTQQNSWAYTMQNLRSVQQHKILFLSGNSKIKNPRQQNYWDMLKFTWCPVFSCLSVTLLIMIAQIVMFIVSVSIGLDKKQDLLQVKALTLLDLGANYSPYIKAGEVYRLIAAQFLHVHFMHLVGNFFTTLIFVSRVQYTFGPIKTLFIYLLSGIGGNIFSVLIKPSNQIVKAGASTSLYGIIGTIIGYLILNWSGFSIIGRLLKCQLIFISIIIILFIFVLTPYNSNIDYFGHLGGFLIGITVSAIHQTIKNQMREKIMRVVFLFICVGLLLLWFLLFYLTT